MFWIPTTNTKPQIPFHIFLGRGKRSRYSDLLREGRSGDGIQVGARFFAPVQTGPEAHPPPNIMGTGPLPWVKRPGRGVDQDHPPPSSAEFKGRVELDLYYPSGLSWPVIGWTSPSHFKMRVLRGFKLVTIILREIKWKRHMTFAVYPVWSMQLICALSKLRNVCCA
jgi:hypothetical protein